MMCTKPRLLNDSQSPQTLVIGIRIRFRVKGLSWRVDCYAVDQQFVSLWSPNFRYKVLHNFITMICIPRIFG